MRWRIRVRASLEEENNVHNRDLLLYIYIFFIVLLKVFHVMTPIENNNVAYKIKGRGCPRSKTTNFWISSHFSSCSTCLEVQGDQYHGLHVTCWRHSISETFIFYSLSSSIYEFIRDVKGRGVKILHNITHYIIYYILYNIMHSELSQATHLMLM